MQVHLQIITAKIYLNYVYYFFNQQAVMVIQLKKPQVSI